MALFQPPKSILLYKFDIGSLCTIWKSSPTCEAWHLHHKIYTLFDEVIEHCTYPVEGLKAIVCNSRFLSLGRSFGYRASQITYALKLGEDSDSLDFT